MSTANNTGVLEPTIKRSGPSPMAQFVMQYGMVLLLVALVIVAAIVYPPFLTPRNLQNTLTQNSSTAIVAMGMTIVMIGGGFDLSVGGTFGLGSVLFAGMVVDGWPVGLALLTALLAGLVCGLINGLIITKLQVNAFIATLGTAAVFLGAAALYSGSKPITVPFFSDFTFLGAGTIGGISILVIVIVVLYVGGGLILSRGTYGRSLYAIGGSEEASRLAGMQVNRKRIIAFVICGLAAALAGAAQASSLSTGQFDQGASVALDSIAAVVVGGTSLFGGEGAMWRTAVGVGILATMNNLFSSLSIASPTQNIIKGIVLIGAVALEVVVRRMRTN